MKRGFVAGIGRWRFATHPCRRRPFLRSAGRALSVPSSASPKTRFHRRSRSARPTETRTRMLGLAIQYCVAVALLLFVVSLPIAKFPIAGTMRRIAAALFLLAFMPSVFFGLISSPSRTDGGELHGGANPLAVIGALVLLSCAAYAILAIRKRLKRSPKDAWSEYVGLRSSGKRPVGSDPRTTHTSSLFEEEP